MSTTIQQSNEKPKTSIIENFMLGGVSAATSKTIAAPIERVKLLLQNQKENKNIKNPYKGIVDCVVRVTKEEGVVSFWRGNTANVLRYFPTQALNFAFKEKYKRLFAQPRSSGFIPCLLGNVASGGAAGATSLLAVYPLDFARTRLAVDVGKSKAEREFKGMVDCIGKTARAKGWFGNGGVYSGFAISCLGIVLYRGAYFGLFDTLSSELKNENATFMKKFALGYAVTVSASFISYPLDTIRRRMMMVAGKSGTVKYANSRQCAKAILQENGGVYNFFNGAGSNAIRALCGALVLVGFDYLRDFYLTQKQTYI